jgi:hypothetical protein
MQIDWRFVDYVMSRWAEWQIANAWFTGYAANSALTAMIEGGAGTKNNGHRILCKDPPRQVQGAHLLIYALPPNQYNAVIVHYGAILNDDGSKTTQQQKAAILSISETALSERLRRARKKVARGLESSTLIN